MFNSLVDDYLRVLVQLLSGRDGQLSLRAGLVICTVGRMFLRLQEDLRRVGKHDKVFSSAPDISFVFIGS